MTTGGAGQDGLTPEQAVDRLEDLHTAASNALREALARFTESGDRSDAAGTKPLSLSRAARRLAAVGRRAFHAPRLGQVPGAGPLHRRP